MARKRRNTAKTGDKRLYMSRDDSQASSAKNQLLDEDEVEAFHQGRDADFLRLDDNGENDSDDDHEPMTTNVLDLGGGGSSSESDSDDDEERHSRGMDPVSEDDEDDDDDSDEESDDAEHDLEELKQADPTDWGRKKSTYYHGDTEDLELGQDQEDAWVEEEAAQQVQASRYKEMDSQDFELSDDESDDENDEQDKKSQPLKRDLGQLTPAQQRQWLRKQHPEFMPLISYFGDWVKELNSTTKVASDALMESETTAQSVGATMEGRQYLLTKQLMEQSAALNVVMYLLLKSTSGDIESHPVLEHLQRWNSVRTKLEEHVETGRSLDDQMKQLVKAVALLKGGDVEESDADEESEEIDDTNEEPVPSDDEEAMDEEVPVVAETKKSSSQDTSLHEARFGLRLHEVQRTAPSSTSQRRRAPVADFGDLDESTPKSFASTMNAIQQRSKTSKRKRDKTTEQLDDLAEDDGKLAEGLRMMEEQMGTNFDDDEEEEVEDMEMADDSDLDDDLQYYNSMAKKVKSKKDMKKQLYEVAPKFPSGEQLVEGERAISHTILKNRGLVAHKAKINRNPRVKKREQYRKALIKRKGAVREVRTGEGHKYAGEETGIKSRISRSRKLVS
eukprot:Nitzschia sp. Nitz4//scaffold2_size372955//207252//209491//NITZ4_000434-RA/size372955-augustus-gene-0.424-mRNA-1//-1//CDS//3329546811//156//frame0